MEQPLLCSPPRPPPCTTGPLCRRVARDGGLSVENGDSERAQHCAPALRKGVFGVEGEREERGRTWMIAAGKPL